MTREKAIEIFKNMLDAWDNYYTIAQSDKKREAVWLAISSLETDEAYQLEYERTTKHDSSELEKNSKKLEKGTTKNNLGVDCISRADAIKAMQDKAKKLKNEDTINGLCGAVAILYELPPATPQLSVSEVTALAEWTEKLTKASEDAYNKGYEAGMKAQEPRKGHWLRRPHVYGVSYCSVCDFELKIDNTNYCPNCGAKMKSEVEDGNDD